MINEAIDEADAMLIMTKAMKLILPQKTMKTMNPSIELW